MDAWLIWALALFVVGLLITAVEVILPSGGLLALAALACLAGSIVCAYQLSGLTAVILGGVEVVCVPLVIVLVFRALPRTRLGKDLILTPPTEADGSNPQSGFDPARVANPFEALRGTEGVVVAPLRPSGTVEIDGRRVSVVSDGQLLDKGRRVRVVLVEGSRVVVEAVEGE